MRNKIFILLKVLELNKIGLQGGKLRPLRNLGHILPMFLDIIELRIENKQKNFRENCFENEFSEIP